MKKIVFILCFLSSIIGLNAQDEKPRFTPVDASTMDMEYFPRQVSFRNFLSGEDRNMEPKAKVIYSRPLKKGRTIFGELIPYGKTWRMGANEATEISFYQTVAIGDDVLPRGTYTLSATVNRDSWEVHFSTQSGIWGSEKIDLSKRVASIKVPVQNSKTELEALSMGFREINPNLIHFMVQWDKTLIEIPVGLNPVVFAGVDKSPMDKITYPAKASYTNYLDGDEANITPLMLVLYSRPYKNNRDIFGELLKPGMWRLGANQSTEITFTQDVKINGKDLKAGKYALFANLKDGSWDFIFSKDFPSAGPYDRDEAKDVLSVNAKTAVLNETVENFTIVVEEKKASLVHLVFAWDKTIVELPIQF